MARKLSKPRLGYDDLEGFREQLGKAYVDYAPPKFAPFTKPWLAWRRRWKLTLILKVLKRAIAGGQTYLADCTEGLRRVVEGTDTFDYTYYMKLNIAVQVAAATHLKQLREQTQEHLVGISSRGVSARRFTAVEWQEDVAARVRDIWRREPNLNNIDTTAKLQEEGFLDEYQISSGTIRKYVGRLRKTLPQK